MFSWSVDLMNEQMSTDHILLETTKPLVGRLEGEIVDRKSLCLSSQPTGGIDPFPHSVNRKCIYCSNG